MGVVYAATHLQLAQKVAIKLILPSKDKEEVQRLQRLLDVRLDRHIGAVVLAELVRSLRDVDHREVLGQRLDRAVDRHAQEIRAEDEEQVVGLERGAHLLLLARELAHERGVLGRELRAVGDRGLEHRGAEERLMTKGDGEVEHEQRALAHLQREDIQAGEVGGGHESEGEEGGEEDPGAGGDEGEIATVHAQLLCGGPHDMRSGARPQAGPRRRPKLTPSDTLGRAEGPEGGGVDQVGAGAAADQVSAHGHLPHQLVCAHRQLVFVLGEAQPDPPQRLLLLDPAD